MKKAVAKVQDDQAVKKAMGENQTPVEKAVEAAVAKSSVTSTAADKIVKDAVVKDAIVKEAVKAEAVKDAVVKDAIVKKAVETQSTSNAAPEVKKAVAKVEDDQAVKKAMGENQTPVEKAVEAAVAKSSVTSTAADKVVKDAVVKNAVVKEAAKAEAVKNAVVKDALVKKAVESKKTKDIVKKATAATATDKVIKDAVIKDGVVKEAVTDQAKKDAVVKNIVKKVEKEKKSPLEKLAKKTGLSKVLGTDKKKVKTTSPATIHKPKLVDHVNETLPSNNLDRSGHIISKLPVQHDNKHPNGMSTTGHLPRTEINFAKEALETLRLLDGTQNSSSQPIVLEKLKDAAPDASMPKSQVVTPTPVPAPTPAPAAAAAQI